MSHNVTLVVIWLRSWHSEFESQQGKGWISCETLNQNFLPQFEIKGCYVPKHANIDCMLMDEDNDAIQGMKTPFIGLGHRTISNSQLPKLILQNEPILGDSCALCLSIIHYKSIFLLKNFDEIKIIIITKKEIVNTNGKC